MGDSSPAVKKIFKAHGYYWARNGKGGHEIWYSPITSDMLRWAEKSSRATPPMRS
jgi:hypothetical protein